MGMDETAKDRLKKSTELAERKWKAHLKAHPHHEHLVSTAIEDRVEAEGELTEEEETHIRRLVRANCVSALMFIGLYAPGVTEMFYRMYGAGCFGNVLNLYGQYLRSTYMETPADFTDKSVIAGELALVITLMGLELYSDSVLYRDGDVPNADRNTRFAINPQFLPVSSVVTSVFKTVAFSSHTFEEMTCEAVKSCLEELIMELTVNDEETPVTVH